MRRTLTEIRDLLLPTRRTCLTRALLSTRAAHLLQTLLRLLQTFQRAFVLRDRLVWIAALRRLRFLQFVGRLIELLGQLLHLRIATFARETFELTRGFARFVDHLLLLSLAAARSSALHLLLATALFFERCLLAASEFFEPTFCFAFLLFRLLLLRPLHGLVLVLHLVELEIEETGEFLLFALTAAAALTALITERDLHFAEDRVGGE